MILSVSQSPSCLSHFGLNIMAILQNQSHEAFAQARAKGARLEDAYEDAGFMPGNGHASRVALRPEVAERIAELRALRPNIAEASTPGVIAALLSLAKTLQTQAGGAKEARLALLEACRLQEGLSIDRRQDR